MQEIVKCRVEVVKSGSRKNDVILEAMKMENSNEVFAEKGRDRQECKGKARPTRVPGRVTSLRSLNEREDQARPQPILGRAADARFELSYFPYTPRLVLRRSSRVPKPWAAGSRKGGLHARAGVADLPTAFEPVRTGRLHLVFCAEYDALPDRGPRVRSQHHRGSSVVRALDSRAVRSELDLSVIVLGTPSEEGAAARSIC